MPNKIGSSSPTVQRKSPSLEGRQANKSAPYPDLATVPRAKSCQDQLAEVFRRALAGGGLAGLGEAQSAFLQGFRDRDHEDVCPCPQACSGRNTSIGEG